MAQIGDEKLVAAEARKAASQAINVKPAKHPVASIVKQMWMKPAPVSANFKARAGVHAGMVSERSHGSLGMQLLRNAPKADKQPLTPKAVPPAPR
jgi:hypothetical protein